MKEPINIPVNKTMNEPMNESADDWRDLQNEWQAYQPDVKKIQKKINWVTWRMIFLLFTEVILVLAYLGYLYHSANSQQNSSSVDIWNYFIGILAVVGLYLDFKLRLPVFRQQGSSTKDILGLYLMRTNMGISLGQWSKLFSWLLLMSFNLWVTINYLYFPEEPRISSIGFILFGNIWIGGFLLICYWYKNKKQMEYEKLKKLWQDYLN